MIHKNQCFKELFSWQPIPKEGELKCYPRIAHSESECIKVLLKSSPPTSGAIKMIHKNQCFKELFSWQPIRKGHIKASQSQIEETQTIHRNQPLEGRFSQLYILWGFIENSSKMIQNRCSFLVKSFQVVRSSETWHRYGTTIPNQGETFVVKNCSKAVIFDIVRAVPSPAMHCTLRCRIAG
jgi:hypothetical protein